MKSLDKQEASALIRGREALQMEVVFSLRQTEELRYFQAFHKSLKLYRQIMAQLTFSDSSRQHNLQGLFMK